MGEEPVSPPLILLLVKATGKTYGQVLKTRTQPSQLLSDTPLPARPVKPHDWTYSTCHTGSIAGPSVRLAKNQS
jgi:type 2A phosphatase activator TIP41